MPDTDALDDRRAGERRHYDDVLLATIFGEINTGIRLVRNDLKVQATEFSEMRHAGFVRIEAVDSAVDSNPTVKMLRDDYNRREGERALLRWILGTSLIGTIAGVGSIVALALHH